MQQVLRCMATLKTKLTIFTVMMGMIALTPWLASAAPTYQLEVNYTNGSILSGPLSFGLTSLPSSVTAMFMLGPGQPGSPSSPGNNITFDETDVSSASITFGSATWTASELNDFSMLVVSGGIRSLTYDFLPINTQVVDGSIVLNFPLTVTGTDRASGQPFEYLYTSSTQTFTPTAVPVPSTIMLFGTGLAGLVFWRMKTQKPKQIGTRGEM